VIHTRYSVNLMIKYLIIKKKCNCKEIKYINFTFLTSFFY